MDQTGNVAAASVQPPSPGPALTLTEKIKLFLNANLQWPLWASTAAVLILFVMLQVWLELSFTRGFESNFPAISGILGEFGVPGCVPLHDYKAHIAELRNPQYNVSWSPFEQWSYLLAAFTHPLYALSVAMTLAIPFLFRRELTWDRLDPGAMLRPVITILALTIVWQGVACDYNLFLDQGFPLDRMILLVSALLVWKHPAFVPWVLILAFTNLGLLRHNIGWLSVADRQDLYDTLVLFLGCLLFSAAQNRSWFPSKYRQNFTGMFVFLTLCMIGSSYVWPAMKKVFVISPHGYEWAFHNQLADHTAYVLNRGWLAFLTPAGRDQLISLVKVLQIPLQIFTLIIEFAALFVVMSRRTSIAILAGVVFLHVGIFALSGICFWKWVIVDTSFAVMLWKMRENDITSIFDRKQIVSLGVVLGAPLYFWPAMLGWFDTPLSTQFEFEIEGVSGKRYSFNKSMLDPYDMYAQFERWEFLLDRPIINIGHGVENHRYFKSLKNGGPDNAKQLVAENGINYFDPAKADRFDRFIESFFGAMNRHGRKPVQFGLLSAPHHVYSGTFGDIYQYQEPIAQVHVRFLEQYWTGRKMVELDNRCVRTISVPSGDSAWQLRGTAIAHRRKTANTTSQIVPVRFETSQPR